jgi:hypothetical protein
MKAWMLRYLAHPVTVLLIGDLYYFVTSFFLKDLLARVALTGRRRTETPCGRLAIPILNNRKLRNLRLF